MSRSVIYRVQFVNQDTIYEIYARQVGESDMFGFMEVEEIVFGETSNVVVDPSEEKLKNEFKGVQRTYIPMHHVVRIDEVEQQGVAKISTYNGADKASNVHAFPRRPLEEYEER